MNPCNKDCCNGVIDVGYLYSENLSAYKIAELCGSSAPHIIGLLKKKGVPIKKREEYPPSKHGGKPRDNSIYALSDEVLFNTPVKQLMIKYCLSYSGVRGVRKVRKEETK
jgi:hypothetical protein